MCGPLMLAARGKVLLPKKRFQTVIASAAERLKRGLQHARQLVRESQSEAEKLVRSQN